MSPSRPILVALTLATLSLAAAAQQPPAPAPKPATPATQQQTEDQIRKEEESQRGFGVVPMFAVTSRHNVPPAYPAPKISPLR